ncbi:MAG: hypothetical protein HC860_04475 [Alkalinema sp. RU_4_3]|nr:hypothetical protein [Alkalinema sp. RU_4_3]
MSQFPHDDFAKAYLAELLGRIGTAIPNRPFKSETRLTDLWFQLKPHNEAQSQQLGLLGQLLIRDSLIEVFRNAPNPIEIRACQSKLSHIETELTRKAKRRKITLAPEKFPYLWIITPTASDQLFEQFQARPTEHLGVYQLPKGQEAGLIVTHHLVPTKETLWLRILGRNGNQQNAIREFAEIPIRNQLYVSIEALLADYRSNLASRHEQDQEDEDLIMQLSALYQKQQQEWLHTGRQEEKKEVAIALLKEGVAIEIIAKTTGLSIEMIQQLPLT